MLYSAFFSEIFESPIIAHRSAIEKYIPYIIAHRAGKILDFPSKPEIKASYFDTNKQIFSTTGDKPENSVAIISIDGLITRSGSWWDNGANDYARLMNEAFADTSIKALVLKTNSLGGTIDSMFPFKAAFAKKNKPVFALVDAKAYSMGYLAIVQADKIYAVDPMAGVGSIGVMATIENDDEYYKKEYGITTIEVYPPESNWKNKPEREAKGGNTDLLIQEQLSPWAQYFQEKVREHRKALNEEVEGVLAGRTFFAKDSKKDGNGLIDGIMSLDDVVDEAAKYDRNKKINAFFNN